MFVGMLDTFLIDLSDKNNLGGGGGVPQPPGFVGYPQPPMLPAMNDGLPGPAPFNYPVCSTYIYLHLFQLLNIVFLDNVWHCALQLLL